MQLYLVLNFMSKRKRYHSLTWQFHEDHRVLTPSSSAASETSSNATHCCEDLLTVNVISPWPLPQPSLHLNIQTLSYYLNIYTQEKYRHTSTCPSVFTGPTGSNVKTNEPDEGKCVYSHDQTGEINFWKNCYCSL